MTCERGKWVSYLITLPALKHKPAYLRQFSLPPHNLTLYSPASPPNPPLLIPIYGVAPPFGRNRITITFLGSFGPYFFAQKRHKNARFGR